MLDRKSFGQLLVWLSPPLWPLLIGFLLFHPKNDLPCRLNVYRLTESCNDWAEVLEVAIFDPHNSIVRNLCLHGGKRRLLLLYKKMMKTVLYLAGLSTCAAFAPAAQRNGASMVTVGATAAEIDAMIGVDVETGKKVVSAVRSTCETTV